MRVDRKSIFLVVILVIILCLPSCMPHETSAEEGNQSSSADGIDNVYELKDLEWQDNSLDAYYAKFNQLLRVTKDDPDEFFLGGSCIVFGNNRTSFFQKHLGAKDPQKSWDELVIATDQQEVSNVKIRFPFTPDNINQAWVMGDVYGSNHYICLNFEGTNDNKLYHLFEADENLKVVRDFYADCFSKEDWEAPDGICQDKDGNVHVLTSFVDEEFSRYYVFGTDGKLIGHCILDITDGKDKKYMNFHLRLMRNGDAAILRKHADMQGRIVGTELFQKDVVTGEDKVILSQEDKATGEVVCYLPWNEETILYVNRIGIFKCDNQWENDEALYRWSKHGITFGGGGIRILDNDEISACYADDDGWHYMVLAPTTEKVEITEIGFATNRKNIFYSIVNEFNKRHPSCHIELISCQDVTKLLSELISGQGPVLIDTALIGFEEQEQLWEPLDEMLRTTGLEKELSPKALECCIVNGKILGLVSDYCVNTVITANPKINDGWTQEEFLDEIEQASSIKVIFPVIPLNYSGNTLIFNYLMHGISDNYLFGGENAKQINVENLKRVFRIAEKYCQDKETESAAILIQSGEALCAEVQIKGLGDVLAVNRVYGNDVRFVGYPSECGGTCYVSIGNPVSMRRTATTEEKTVAYAFLREWMSYDGQAASWQSDVNYGISIREDIFNEQLENVIQSEMENYSDKTDDARKVFENELRENADFLKRIIEKAHPQENLPRDLENLMWDELTEYFDGNITQEQVTEHLKKRTSLYFEENLR
ncbi:MAG: ABC transporter substrate-binding protein [Acetatifactor sp.]|nr:ABC transporter substrate-binding protein [Acetatifactor sp.]